MKYINTKVAIFFFWQSLIFYLPVLRHCTRISKLLVMPNRESIYKTLFFVYWDISFFFLERLVNLNNRYLHLLCTYNAIKGSIMILSDFCYCETCRNQCWGKEIRLTWGLKQRFPLSVLCCSRWEWYPETKIQISSITGKQLLRWI